MTPERLKQIRDQLDALPKEEFQYELGRGGQESIANIVRKDKTIETRISKVHPRWDIFIIQEGVKHNLAHFHPTDPTPDFVTPHYEVMGPFVRDSKKIAEELYARVIELEAQK